MSSKSNDILYMQILGNAAVADYFANTNGELAVNETNEGKRSLKRKTTGTKPSVAGELAVNETNEGKRSLKRKTTGTKPSVAGRAKKMKPKADIDWEQYFMGVALISASRSKDPDKKVGACIVNSNNRIVGIGYNGMPDQGIVDNDVKFSWEKIPKKRSKLLYVCHAEMNAIVNKMSADVRGCTVYTTLYPCNECSKLMIQSGIIEIVYLEDKGFRRAKYAASKLLLEETEVKCRKYKSKGGPTELLEALQQL